MASYLIANDIPLASKPCCEAEFVKTCNLSVTEEFLGLVPMMDTATANDISTLSLKY